jgi:hypothetical protein
MGPGVFTVVVGWEQLVGEQFMDYGKKLKSTPSNMTTHCMQVKLLGLYFCGGSINFFNLRYIRGREI